MTACSRARCRTLVLATSAFVAFACSSTRQPSVGSAADSSAAATAGATATASGSNASCSSAGLTLPPGFCATIFADSVGSARHLVVAANGDVFVNIQAGRINAAIGVRPGVLGLRDTNGDGIADVRERFADTGNTGIGLYDGHLYLDVGHSIVRYPISAGSLRPRDAAETVVSGLPTTPGHRARNFAITRDGSLIVNIGSPSNSCQVVDRRAGSPGKDPCPELETRAGLWRFDAGRVGQRFTAAERLATGIRNATGIAVEPSTGTIYAATHGRDLLNDFPAFTVEQNADLPAEELLLVERGDDFGWPYCYWDPNQRKRVLAPEYGGDGQQVGRCAKYKGNVSAMPAHWAPLSLTFYTGMMFPAKYRGGAFIAFHGSWNRAPLPQAGYNVVFIPFTNGQIGGNWETFASGFAPADVQPRTAKNRPTGVAVGPDGALYVSDDAGGRIWRIVYRGSAVLTPPSP